MKSVIRGPYWRDIMAQPEALAATLDECSRVGAARDVSAFLKSKDRKRIVLTGMGSSFHMLHVLNLRLIELGIPTVMMETSELVYYARHLLDAQTLVVAVSQSGASAETVRLLELRGAASLLGLTNTEGSPLAQRADFTLLTRAGPEHSVSCKTYVAALLELQWLAGLFGRESEALITERLRPAAELVHQYLACWSKQVESLAARLPHIRQFFLAGRGTSLCAAGTGALLLKEAAHVAAEGLSSAALRHGPIEMLGHDMLTCVFAGDTRTRHLNEKLVRELAQKQLPSELIGPNAAVAALRLPECDQSLLPILEIMPIQMMTLTIAALKDREAGSFERAKKITDIE